MFKVELIVTAMLSVVVAGKYKQPLCRHGDKFKPVDVNMDEISNKRMNIMFVYENQESYAHDYSYVDVFKTGDSRYDAIVTFPYLNKLGYISGRTTFTYRGGIMSSAPETNYDPRHDAPDYKMYILAKSNEGAMLVFLCQDYENPYYTRFIIVPSNSTLTGRTEFQLVPNEHVLSEESLSQLLAVDRSYNFTRKLKKVKYVLQGVRHARV